MADLPGAALCKHRPGLLADMGEGWVWLVVSTSSTKTSISPPQVSPTRECISVGDSVRADDGHRAFEYRQ